MARRLQACLDRELSRQARCEAPCTAPQGEEGAATLSLRIDQGVPSLEMEQMLTCPPGLCLHAHHTPWLNRILKTTFPSAAVDLTLSSFSTTRPLF